MATYWVKTSADVARVDDGVEQLVEASSLPDRPASGPVLAEVLRGVVADLLERGEQLEHQAPPRDALAPSPISAIVSRTTAS